MHVAVILPRWVGDAVMATPMLRALATHVGDRARVTAVARPLIGELLDGNGWFDRVIPYDRHRRDPTLGFAAAARQLRADRPDVVLVLPGSLSAAALAWCGGARRRIGLAGGWRRPLLTDVVGPRTSRRDPVPPPAAFMAVAAGMGVAPGSSQLVLVATAADLARGDALLAELFPGRSGPLVVLNDNSSNGSARAWGEAKLATLAGWLVERIPGCRVLVHCGPGDRQQARAVVDIAGHPAVRGLADVSELPIGLSKALYARAALAVTSDSGPRHIAAAFRVPTVALLGPTDPRLGRSDPDRCQELRVDLACAPCGHASCPLGHHDCMRLLDVEQVGRAALALWQRSASAPGHRAG